MGPHAVLLVVGEPVRERVASVKGAHSSWSLRLRIHHSHRLPSVISRTDPFYSTSEGGQNEGMWRGGESPNGSPYWRRMKTNKDLEVTYLCSRN